MTDEQFMQRPEVFVLGGPNGAGKTTGASVLLPESLGLTRFVNADLIAKGLSPFDPDASAIEAGRLMLNRIRTFRDHGETFAFESTLASRTFAPFLADAAEKGYIVHIAYVWLSRVDLAIQRVRVRVRKGGHHVPDDTVRRRYHRGLRNFFDLYVPLANRWVLCDNSSDRLVVVARGRTDEEPKILDNERYESIRRATEHARKQI